VRLFVAIEIDEAARGAIHETQQRIASAFGSDARMLRFVRAEHLHVTLLFLGEVAEARLLLLVDALRPPIALAPFTLTLGGVGVFPPRGAPRVLWLGLAAGAEAAIALHAQVAARVGVPPAGHDGQAPFTPHLTLGRWRDGRPRHREALGSRAEPVGPLAVDAVVLFRSDLSSQGPTHTALLRTPLA